MSSFILGAPAGSEVTKRPRSWCVGLAGRALRGQFVALQAGRRNLWCKPKM